MYYKFLVIISILLIGLQSIASSCKPFGSAGVSFSQKHLVSSYNEDYSSCMLGDDEILSLRSFELDGTRVNLITQTNQSETSIINSECLTSCKEVNPNYFSNSHYGRNYLDSFLSPYPLTNDGLTYGPSRDSIALTIDMCPSSKGISSEVYERLDILSSTTAAAVPVGIAMTRRWLKRWPEEFNYIKSLQLSGKLDVTWVNHSANHKYSRKLPLEANFLLMPNTDMEDEVLGNEVALIEKGVTPSVYFRFPGLVSDYDTIQYVAHLGLITLGSNAWLGKGEEPQFGSIILIHGNRNEVVGEKKLFKYIDNMVNLGHSFGSLGEVLK